MRQIVLDTETTGLEVSQGHRVIEIGCIELVNRRVTGNHWHYYFNPDREVDIGAFEVHGISNEFLQDKPCFAELADEFYRYVEGAELVIHNAAFDMGFLNRELSLLDRGRNIRDRRTISTHCVSVMTSTIVSAVCTAPCSMRVFWPTSTWR